MHSGVMNGSVTDPFVSTIFVNDLDTMTLLLVDDVTPSEISY